MPVSCTGEHYYITTRYTRYEPGIYGTVYTGSPYLNLMYYVYDAQTEYSAVQVNTAGQSLARAPLFITLQYILYSSALVFEYLYVYPTRVQVLLCTVYTVYTGIW